LAEGTRYVYDRVHTNEKIVEEWIHSELASAANVYQSLARDIWQAIIKRTQESNKRQICQATQLAGVNNALSFLAEANAARNQHLGNFQGNVELWAIAHQDRLSILEWQLQEARAEIQRIATRIPLPPTPVRQPVTTEAPAWRSPRHPINTSTPMEPPSNSLVLGSPLRLSRAPTQHIQPPAVPTMPEMRQRLNQLRCPAFTLAPLPGPVTAQGGDPLPSAPGSSPEPP